MPYADLEKRRKTDRDSHKRRRDHARRTARAMTQALEAAASGQSLPVARHESDQLAQRSAQAALALILEKEKVGLPRIIRKVRQKMGSKQLRAINGQAVEVADNDAQLRAADILLE